jgi:cytidylate kinase
VDDVASLTELSSRLSFRLRDGRPAELEVEGWTVDELETEEVEDVVSAVSRHPEVRAVLREVQRSLGREGAVMEGRDIGSVVFPNAAVKLYLVADPAVRAARRSAERSSGTTATGAAIATRDARDAATTPAEPAGGAHVIDTTDLDIGGVLDAALAAIARSAPELLG